MSNTESIIMFKPDAQDVQLGVGINQHLLHEVGSAILVASGFVVVDYRSKTLGTEEVQALYAKALAPNPEDDAIWGTAWKDDVVKHISSGPVESYLLHRDHGDAIEKAKLFKNTLRTLFDRNDDVVRNIAHVPDEDEMEIAKKILFAR